MQRRTVWITWTSVGGAFVALLLSGSMVEAAPAPGCIADVERSIAYRTACLLRADARYQRDENDRRLLRRQERCQRAFAARFDRAKVRHGAENCTPEEASALAAELDVCIDRAQNVASGLASTPAYRFVQTSDFAVIGPDGTSLLLVRVDAQTSYYALQSGGSSGSLETELFVRRWGLGPEPFVGNPPAAFLQCTGNDGRRIELEVVVSDPEMSTGEPIDLQYSAQPPSTAGEGASLPEIACSDATLSINGESGHILVGATSLASIGAPASRMTSAAWYSAWYDINLDDTTNIDDMKANGITDVFLVAGWIDPPWTPYVPVMQQKCSSTRACVDGSACNAKGRCPKLFFDDFYAFVQKNDPGLRIWVQYERQAKNTAEGIAPAIPPAGPNSAKVVIDTLSGTVGSTGRTILDVIEGVATDFEPPWPGTSTDMANMENFHIQMAAQLNAKGKRYAQWIGPESLSAGYLAQVAAESGVSDFLLIPPMYDRGPNPPDALPPAMYQFLVEAQLGYQAECDTSPCQDQLQLPDTVADLFTLPTNPCSNMAGTSPWTPTCTEFGLPSCTSGLDGYGNYECWAEGGVENCPGTGPLGSLLKANDGTQKIQIVVGAPFSATTSEWTKLKGYNGATMPTWKPDAVTTSDQYPLCVRGSYTTDSSGVVSNGTVPNGQGDYIYALGNALNSLLTKESDFAARFGGVYAYGYNDGLEADSVICQSSPCGCAINTPVASKCDQTTKVPIVFMTENDAGNVNRIAQSSWDAWKAVEAQLPPAP
jgi:hypothetical protein